MLAAAGSAVGLGNIWRSPYLAAKDGGGLFLVVYILLALTISHTGDDGVTRTGLEGFKVYVIPNLAAITSAVSVMEAVVVSIMDEFHMSRNKAGIIEGLIALVGGKIVCMDYISNNCLMPVVAFLTCILIGWVLKPKTVIDEVEKNGNKMGRKKLYVIMLKYVAPIFLILLLLQTLGILKLGA